MKFKVGDIAIERQSHYHWLVDGIEYDEHKFDSEINWSVDYRFVMMTIFRKYELLDYVIGGKWWKDGSGAMMQYNQVGLQGLEWEKWNLICACFDLKPDVLKRIGENWKLYNVMVNKVPPETHIPIHVDTLLDSGVRRFHYPLQVSEACYFWSESKGYFTMSVGDCVEFNYRERHCLGNNSSTQDRVHLIIDFVQ